MSPVKESTQQEIITAGGRITCRRCQAHSKRTKLQCGNPAERGKRVCRFHGARSTGARTLEGRQRCAEVRTIHGRETRAIRKERKRALARLQALAEMAKRIGLITR